MKKGRPNPPPFALTFLQWFCPGHLYEEIEGDLIQRYHKDIRMLGERRARRRFRWNVVRFFRPGIMMRQEFFVRSNRAFLIQNYFKTTFRHLRKSKVNFIFKLSSLTVALLSFLILSVYVSYHLSFDRYHNDYDRIFRINSEWTIEGKKEKWAQAPAALGPALKAEFPEVKSFTRIQHHGEGTIRYGQNIVRSDRLIDADSSIFDVLTFNFIQGTRHALRRPGSVVLTQTMAGRIFGKEDPLNKMISFPERLEAVYQVTGVIEDPPSNTHLPMGVIVPFNSLRDSAEIVPETWSVDSAMTDLYVRFESQASIEQFLSKVEPLLKENVKNSIDDRKTGYTMWMQPVADIHLDPDIFGEANIKLNKVYIYFFSMLAVFLLAIAGINYINLSIADFHNRSKEIGVRKILGAAKKQIAFQVVLEALFFCLLAWVVSVSILYFVFPTMLVQFEPHLQFNMLFDPRLMKTLVITSLLLVLLTTVYPAYRLSTNSAARDLKQDHGLGRNLSVSNKLLGIQFIISIVCISATMIVGRQVEYIHTKDPGYDRRNIVAFILPDRYPPERVSILKNEFSRMQGVEAVSYSYLLLGGGQYFKDWYTVEIDGAMKRMELNETFCDHDFFRLTGMQVVAGREFDRNNPADSHTAFIVNETAVKEFRWKDPIGKRMATHNDNPKAEKWEGTVVGVVKDANILSLHDKIEPLVMRLQWDSWPGYFLYVKIAGPFQKTFSAVKTKYGELMPGFLVNYRMVEDRYNGQYEDVNKALAVLQLGTWIIVLISSLGIFSLSVYMSVRRMKEFGIRKVLGATVGQIALLQVNHFLKIALVANVIALPISFWIMSGWLDEFAYRRELNGLVFLSVTGISVFLVVVSAGYSSWRAGTMNPVDVIKTQ